MAPSTLRAYTIAHRIRRSAAAMHRFAAALVAIAAIALHAAPAVAADAGPDVRAMRITLDGQGPLEVWAARSAPIGKPIIGAQVEYLARPLVVRSIKGDKKVLRELVYERLQVGLGGSMHILESFTLAAFLPMTAFQNGTNPPLYGEGRGQLRASALGDAVVFAKYVLKNDTKGLGYGLVLPVTFPTATPDAYMGRDSIGIEPTFVASTMDGHWHYAANVGASIHETRETFGLKQGSTGLIMVGASYDSDKASGSLSRYWFDTQLRYQMPIHGNYGDINQHSLELSGALRIPMGRGLFMTVGVGFGLLPGVGVPAVRPFAQLQYKAGDENRGKLKPLIDPLGVPRSGT